MSVVTIAELMVAYQGDTSGHDRANLKVRQDLLKTATTAEETATAVLELAAAIGATSIAYEAASVQAATYNRVVRDSVKVSQAAAAAFAEATKGATSIEAALDIVTVAARSAATGFGLVDKAAVDLRIAALAARTEVQGLGRTLGSTAATGYATRAQASAKAIEALGLRADATKAQIVSMNAALASGQGLRLPGGGASSGGSSLQKWGSAGREFASKIGLPVLAVGAAASKVAMDFDAATARIQAFAGASKAEVDSMKPKFLEVGETFGISAKEIADGYFHIRSAIKDTKTATDVLSVSAKAAGAGLGHMEEVANVITSARYSFGRPAKEIADIVTQAATLSHADPSAFFRNMGQAIPIAADLKIKLNDIAGLVAIMTREGLSPAKGFQRVTAMMDSLSAPTSKQRDAAKMLGIDFGQFRKEMQRNLGAAFDEVYTKAKGNLEKIRAFFGARRAGDAALAFFNPSAVEENIRVLKDMAGAAGTVDRAWNTASASTRVSVNQMNVAVQNAAIRLGTAVAPAVVSLSGDVRGLADAFSALSPSVQANVVKAGAAVAVAGALTSTTVKGVEAVTAFGGVLTGASKALGVTTLATRAAAASGLALNAAFLPEIATLALVAGAAYGLYKAYESMTDGGNAARRMALDEARARQVAAEAKAGDAKRASDLAQEYATLAGRIENMRARHEDTRKVLVQMGGIMDQLRAISPFVAHGFDAQAGSLVGIAKNANLASQEYAKLSAEARRAALQTASTKLVNIASARYDKQSVMDDTIPGSDTWKIAKTKRDEFDRKYRLAKAEQLALMHPPKVDETKVAPLNGGEGGKRPPLDYGDGGVSGRKSRAEKEGPDLAELIVKHATDSIRTPKGQASCAYFASEVIRAAGGKIGVTGNARTLRDELVAGGAQGHPLSEAKPGDVIIYRGGRYGSQKYDENGERVGYHAAILMADGTVRGSSGGRVTQRPMYDPAHATAYTLPDGKRAEDGRLASARDQASEAAKWTDQAYEIAKATALVRDATKSAALAYDIAAGRVEGYREALARGNVAQAAAILQAAKHSLNLVYQQEKAEAAAKEHDALASSIQRAREAANEASRDLDRMRIVAGPGDPSLNGAAFDLFGKRYGELTSKENREIAAQRANALKSLKAAQYDPSEARFDNGDGAAEENRARRVARQVEDAHRSAQQYDDAMARLRDKRDEGNAAPSLAARRAQYIKEQVDSLDSTGDLAKDLERQRAVAKAAAEAFDAAPMRAYRDAIRSVSRELAELGPRTDAARLAAIRFDADGLERMDEASARTVLSLQKLVDKERAFREQSRQAGDAAGRAFADGLNASLDHGLKLGLRALLQSVDQQVREAVVGNMARGVSAWVTRSIDSKDPNRRAIEDAAGAGKGGPVVANTSATIKQTTEIKRLTSRIEALIKAAGGDVPDDPASRLKIPGLASGIVSGESNGVPDFLQGVLGGGAAVPGGSVLGSLFDFLPHFAKGGPVAKGTRGVRNEEGPEMFIAPVDGYVLPADLTARVRGGGMSSTEGSGTSSSAGSQPGETHNHFHHSPTINVAGPVDRRSQQQIKAASYEGAREAWDRSR